MTPAEFINTSKSFKSGYIYVVSGQDINFVMDLLYQSKSAIQTTGKDAVVYDFRCRLFGDPTQGGCVAYADDGVPPTRRWLGDKHIQSILWESYSVLIQKLSDEGSPLVMLVGNQFDPNDFHQNPSPISLNVDVIMDLMSPRNVPTVVAASGKSPTTGFTRELYQFITEIYFYDTNSDKVSFIKERIRQRPDIVGDSQSITVLSPASFDTFKRGKNLIVKWDSYDIPRGSDFMVDLYQGGFLLMTLAQTTPDSGEFTWKLPLWMNTGGDFFVRVTLLSGVYTVHGDSNVFTII